MLTVYFFIALTIFVIEFGHLLEVFHKTNPWLKNIPFVGEFGLSTISIIFLSIFGPLYVIYSIVWVTRFLCKVYSSR